MKKPRIPKNAQGNELNSSWLAAAQHKDLQAYNRLVMNYQDQVYSFAYFVLCNQVAAVQATEQAFALAYQRVSKYRGGTFLFWLFQNLVEVCRTRPKRKPAFPADSDQALPLTELALDLRLAIVLVDLEGLDYLQAAQITGRSPRQLAKDVAQARLQLCPSACL